MKKAVSIGRINKNKGSNAERLYASIFRELGFLDCQTSRFCSKKLDNSGIDLTDIPFNIQIKAGKQKGLNAGKELLYVETKKNLMFSETNEVHSKPILLIHHNSPGRGIKRLPEHSIIYMSLKQFRQFKKLNKSLKYIDYKEYKLELKSQFKDVVSMSFEYFKNEIIKYYDKNIKQE